MSRSARIGSPEAMSWEPPLTEDESSCYGEITAAELSDAVLEYIDDNATDVVRTIDRHYCHGRVPAAEALTYRLVREIKQYVPGSDDFDSDTIATMIEDAMMTLLG